MCPVFDGVSTYHNFFCFICSSYFFSLGNDILVVVLFSVVAIVVLCCVNAADDAVLSTLLLFMFGDYGFCFVCLCSVRGVQVDCFLVAIIALGLLLECHL